MYANVVYLELSISPC